MSPAAQEAQPFPWQPLMALFIGERRLAPRDFWALTIPEVRAVLAPGAGPATRRDELARLMEAFPDG